jgi:predicted RNA binding protein YcfA (HicA-like mRNA interferase family)
MQQVETLLSRFGFVVARVGGSHHIYEFEEGNLWRQIVIPLHGRKVKAIYIKKVIELLDGLFPIEDIEDEEEDENE